MSYKELKDAIGCEARDIILKELKLSISDDYPCCITKHRKGKSARMVYFEDGDSVTNAFYCHDCKEYYDIINHAEKYHSKSVKLYLERLAKGKVAKPQLPKKTKVVKDLTKVKEINPFTTELHQDALEWLESRHISRYTAEVYGVTGSEDEAHFNYYIPVEGEDGEIDYNLVFLKARKLGTIENGKDKYRCQKGGTPVLFGMHTYTTQTILIIVEGEIDCMSFYEGIRFKALTDRVIVCSIPTGTSHTWIHSCKSFIEMFEMIVIISDNDEAGIKFREQCFQDMLYVKDLRWVDMGDVLPKGKKFNDINDYLKLSGKAKVAELMTKIEKQHHSCGTSGAKIKRGRDAEYIKTGWFGMDRALQGMRLGDLTMLVGDSND